MEFIKIVKKQRSSRNKPFNFQSSQNGVFFFKHFSDFFSPFVAASPKFTPTCCSSMIFTPRRDLHMNMYLDFDFKGREPVQLLTLDLAKFAKKVGKLVGSQDIVLTKRCYSYIKTTKSEQYHAFGFHLWVLGKFSLKQCKMVRDTIISDHMLTPLRKKYNFYNLDENCVDKSPALRSNGLFIVGDRKPGLECGPHFICYAKGKVFEHGWETQNHELFCSLLEEMYSFIWEPKGEEQILEKTRKTPDPVVSLKTNYKSTFNLPLFLETTKGRVPNNREWKQLCVFFRAQGLDCRTTNDLCEKAG